MENLNATKCADLKILNAELTQMSDKDLYRKCQEFGSLSLQYRREFCGLLPEVNRRRLFEKYKFHSIYELASKLAGLSNEIVDKILRLDNKLADKPFLREKLHNGEIGYTKLHAIAAIAKPENERMWAQKAVQMSKPALELFVKEIRQQKKINSGPGASLPKGDIASDVEVLEHEKKETLSFKVTKKLAARLRVYKHQLEKECKKELNWEDFFEKLLEEKQQKAKSERKRKALLQQTSARKINLKNNHKPSRHIPVAIKHEVEQRSEGICEYPNCFKTAEHFHHTERFALTGRHTNIKNLCKAHHEIAHHGLIAAEEKDTSAWKLQFFPDLVEPKFEIDRAVKKFSTFHQL